MGVAGPMTGSLAAFGEQLRRGSELAVKNINANGGVLLGLGGVSVKSHGGTDARGFATACRLAADLATSHYPEEVAANLARIQQRGTATG